MVLKHIMIPIFSWINTKTLFSIRARGFPT